uniref:Uncharacterized protein n=1 Tax=Rhizophora mucronata TaxID=61149 RepID=A0A2P2R550_RHIMU
MSHTVDNFLKYQQNDQATLHGGITFEKTDQQCKHAKITF